MHQICCHAYTHHCCDYRGYRPYRTFQRNRDCQQKRLIDSQSQASVSDLNAELEKARAKSGNTRDGSSPDATLRSLLFKLPGGDNNEMEREMQNVERIRASSTQPGGKRPEDMSPQELHAVLWQVLTFRDSGSYIPQCACTRLLTGLRTVVKKIDKTIGASGRSHYKTSVLRYDLLTREDPWTWPADREAHRFHLCLHLHYTRGLS